MYCFEISKTVFELFWIKLKPDKMIMKFSLGFINGLNYGGQQTI